MGARDPEAVSTTLPLFRFLLLLPLLPSYSVSAASNWRGTAPGPAWAVQEGRGGGQGEVAAVKKQLPTPWPWHSSPPV